VQVIVDMPFLLGEWKEHTHGRDQRVNLELRGRTLVVEIVVEGMGF
jgi:hypothetical protein